MEAASRKSFVLLSSHSTSFLSEFCLNDENKGCEVRQTETISVDSSIAPHRIKKLCSSYKSLKGVFAPSHFFQFGNRF